MASTGVEGTFLEKAKAQREKQERFLRDRDVKELPLYMLGIGATNKLLTPKQCQLIAAIRMAADDSGMKRLHRICDLVEELQLSAGEPDNFRSQFLSALKSMAGVVEDVRSKYLGKEV